MASPTLSTGAASLPMPLPGWDQPALDALARETGCGSVDVESPGKIVALLAILLVVSAIAAGGLTVAHYYWFVVRPRRRESVVQVETQTTKHTHKAGRGRGRRALIDYEGLDPTPNLENAKEHLRLSSPVDKDGKWRSIAGTSVREIGLFGGPGLGLYFTLLIYVGLGFSYQFIFSLPGTVFAVLGNFAPAGSGIFPQVTISNLGTESTGGVAQENRLVVIGCQGMPLSDLTKFFGWLDFAGTVLFTACACWLAFFKVPRTAKELDRISLQPSDYSLQVEGLPLRISDHAKYQELLRQHFEQRIAEARKNQAKFYKGGTPSPKVCDVVLVHDREMLLGKQKERAGLMLQKEISDYKQDADRSAKLQEKIDKLSQSIDEVDSVRELDVLRAFVTFNASDDVVGLLFQYRFARFWIFRQYQRSRLRFQGVPIHVKRAPEPSNIFWQNQDAPWKTRLKRKLLVLLVCLVVMAACLGLMFATSKHAQTLVEKYETPSSTGTVSCSSDTPPVVANAVCQPQGWTVQNVGGSWVMVDSMGVSVPSQTKETLDCFCSFQGVSAVLGNPDLRIACEDLLTAYGLRLAITLLAAIIVVVVNVAMAAFLMVIAAWELPLSISELNNAQMMKVFISQTLNTACIVFAVHYDNINDFQRSWYVIIGVAIYMTMTTNVFINAACYFAIWGVAALKRMCKSIENLHQVEVLELYTNPPWDMASRYAYLLMTVYVTLIYSSGMPLLSLLAILYCISSFWSDKLVLLWGSSRPPLYDEKMPSKTAWWLIYAGAVHCVAAIAMYGQPCVFPSNPLGGALGQLSTQALVTARNGTASGIPDDKVSGMANTFFDRLGRDSTWMFAFMFFVMVALGVLYVFTKAIGSTIGEFLLMVKASCCPSRSKVVPDDQSSTSWPVAAAMIDRETPPSSYRMEEHPDFKRLAKFLK